MAASPAPALDSWFVSVDGKSYGPYTEDQIAAFIREGRITATSPVMRHGEAWANASSYVQLGHLFAPAPAAPGAMPAPAPVSAPAPAPAPAPTPAPQPAPEPAPDAVAVATPEATAAPSEGAEEDLAKVLIIAELRTGSSVAFEAAVSRLGKTYRLNHYVWLVHTALPLAQVRKDIAGHVGRNDPLFIADTTHGRAAWVNFGPGAEATIKALWRGV